MSASESGYSARPLIEKLGIEPGARVSVLGVSDAGFLRQLRERTPNFTQGRARKGSDLIVVSAERRTNLERLERLRSMIHQAGAIWVVWPKGKPSLKEEDIRAAALSNGLVDIKVIAFSSTHSGLKLVIPRAQRGAGAAFRRGGKS